MNSLVSAVNRATAAFAAVLFLILVLDPSPARAATCPEAAVAQRAAEALMAASRSGSPSAFASALRSNADMNAITTFALGKNRSKVSAGKRGELVSATTSYISRTFNDYRLKFRAESITIKSCGSGGLVQSNMFFLGGKGNQPVDWRIKGGKVVDVNVQNVWLGQLLRTNFQDILDRNNGDANALLRELKK
jgi:ABC-type transporter MlaC component